MTTNVLSSHMRHTIVSTVFTILWRAICQHGRGASVLREWAERTPGRAADRCRLRCAGTCHRPVVRVAAPRSRSRHAALMCTIGRAGMAASTVCCRHSYAAAGKAAYQPTKQSVGEKDGLQTWACVTIWASRAAPPRHHTSTTRKQNPLSTQKGRWPKFWSRFIITLSTFLFRA